MGDWSFRSLGDIIDRSNFQSVPPCDKLVNSLTNTRHPHFYIWSFPEADKGMFPISVYPQYWNWTLYTCDASLGFEIAGLWTRWKGSFQNAL